MALSSADCSAVILAGGRSRRMGTCKALLPWQGVPVARHIADQLSMFDEILLSANDPDLGRTLSLPCVPDQYPDAGPLSGLYSALSATEKQWLFCVPCDLPCFQDALPRLLLEAMEPDLQAIVCRDSAGNLHPLCGIYRRDVLPLLKDHLDQGKCKVRLFLNELSFRILDTGAYLSDSLFYNINTPEAYRNLTEISRK